MTVEKHTRGTVVVVDDEPTISEIVSRYLERAGYATFAAADGRSALGVIDAVRPDLVVLDLMMPGIDGLEVLRRVRERPAQRTAVILLTAKGEESDRITGLRLGADDYVVKPFSPAELVARVDAILRRIDTVPALTAPLRFDRLVIGPAGRRVHVDGEELQLTQREFDLLAFLAAHPGQAFTREELMDHVWQFSFYSDTSTVTVHIRRLRAKLERHATTPEWVRPSGASATDSAGELVTGRRVIGGTLAVGLAAAAGAGVLLAYDRKGALTTFLVLALLGLATVAATDFLVARRTRVGGLRRQAGLLALVLVAQSIGGVTLFAALMFFSTHDAVLTFVLALYASALGLWAARQLARTALTDVAAIRATLGAVGDGRRDVRTGVTGDDEVARLATDVDAMVVLLDKEERARRTLIAGVSHDLRTPITALRLLAEAIDDDIADPATRREYAARMGTHVRALGALIDDLFELTRLERGELSWTMEQIDLGRLLTETASAMQPAAAAGMVLVRADDPSAGAAALAEPEQVRRVLFNLVQNAIRHRPPDGSVTLKAERVGAVVEVEVADTGSGIPAAEREHVFEPFWRGDPARSHDGAGLGLAISRAIVEGHGGRIWLEPSAVGARVRFCLPAAA